MACGRRRCVALTTALVLAAAGCGGMPLRKIPMNPVDFEKTMREAEYGIVCGEIDARYFGRDIPNITHFTTLALRKPPEPRGGGADAGQPNTVLTLTGRGSNYFFFALPPGRYTPVSVKDVAYYHLGQTQFWFGPPEIPLPQTDPVEIRPGELAYIGKLVLALPVDNVTIESFVTVMKEKLLFAPERAARVKSLGQDFEGALPPLLNSYSPEGFFYLLFVEEDVGGLRAYADRIWGESSLYRGLKHTSSLLRGPGFQYADLRSDKDKAKAFNDKGLADFHGGKLAEALQAYERSIALDPEQPSPYNNRGLISLMRGGMDDAIADFDRAIARDRKFGHAYHNRAKARAEKGLFEAAQADYEVALQLKGKDGNLLDDRGSLYAAMGDMDRACADFRAACERKVCANYEKFRREGACR